MNVTLVTKSMLPVALAGLLLAAGCHKNDQNAQQAGYQQPPANGQQAPPAATPAQTTPPPAQATPPPAETTPPPAATAAPVAAAVPPPPPKPTSYTIPAGTHIHVRVGSTISSKNAHVGDRFDGTLTSPIVVHGHTVVHSGAAVSGRVVDANAQGRIKGGAVLGIQLDSVNVGGRTVPITTDAYAQQEKGKGKRSAGFIGGGAGLGALVGGLAGGGKGALIGGVVGAGAGTAGTAFTGNKQIVIPAETVLTFTLQNSVRVPA
jgi:hypothetical protein